MLGCFRAAAQFISFEAIMGMVFLVAFTVYNAFNFELCVDLQSYLALAVFLPTLALVLLVAFFMETNRPPFDLSEAESDVVAGYNAKEVVSRIKARVKEINEKISDCDHYCCGVGFTGTRPGAR